MAVTPSGSSTVISRLNYLGPMSERPRFHAIDSWRDRIVRDRRMVRIEDAREWQQQPSLAREGFALFGHESSVSELRNEEELARTYPREIEQFVRELSGADRVVIADRGVLRLNERNLPKLDHFHVLRPAHFVHADITQSTAVSHTERWSPFPDQTQRVRRYAHYNVWRVLTLPPQDIPLAVCDSRTVSPLELIDTDSVIDIPGMPETSTVMGLVHYSPRHRWSYFSNMRPDEVLVFKSYDSDPDNPRHVPHSAFRNPMCPSGITSRESVEMRAIAFWLED